MCHFIDNKKPLIENSIQESLFSFQTCGEGATRWHDGKESEVITYAHQFLHMVIIGDENDRKRYHNTENGSGQVGIFPYL